MKLNLRIASIVLGGLFALPLHAAGVDPLWAKVVAQSAENKKWIAQDVEMAFEGNADGKEQKRKVHSQLTGWEKDKPQYKVIAMDPPADPAKPAGKDGSDAIDKLSMGEEMIKIDAPVVRKDGQQLDGKPATMFVVEKSDGPMDMKMQVWVDPATGNIYKMQTHAHAMLMMDVQLTSIYKQHTSGISLPSKSDFKMEILIPFKGAKMKLVNTSSNWVQRPL
jgi:hypothetical protein